MVAATIAPGQQWRATSLGDGVSDGLIEIIRQVDDWLWLVRTELGLMVEMTDDYVVSSYALVSAGDELQSA